GGKAGGKHPALVKGREAKNPEPGANDERHGPGEFPEPVYLFPVRDRGADATEEGADLEVPDDGTVRDAREEELEERDGDEEPATDDDREDADDEAAHEDERRLPRKQPGRDLATPREVYHGTSLCRPRRTRRDGVHLAQPRPGVARPEMSPRRLGGERRVVLQRDGLGRVRDAGRGALDHRLDLATGELDGD